MSRTITVAKPGLTGSLLTLSEAGTPEGRMVFRGLQRRTAVLDLGNQQWTFTTLGLLGRTVRATIHGQPVGELRQTGVLGRRTAEVNGRRYRLAIGGALRRRYSWIAPDGSAAMCMRLSGLVKTAGRIDVPDAVVLDDVAVLIGFALIARRASQNDSAGVG